MNEDSPIDVSMHIKNYYNNNYQVELKIKIIKNTKSDIDIYQKYFIDIHKNISDIYQNIKKYQFVTFFIIDEKVSK